MKKAFSVLSKYLIILFCCILVGFLLLLIVNCIPSQWMVQQAKESAHVLSKEAAYYATSPYWPSGRDNFSDSLMLGKAVYPSRNPLQNTLKVARQTYYQCDPFDSFIHIWLPDQIVDESLIGEEIYPRYWHGYLIFLKPLLVFLNYKQIRLVNTIVLSGLTGFSLWLMARSKKTMLCCVPFLLMAACMFPGTVVHSLHFSSTVYVMLIALICMLLFSKKLDVLQHGFLFSIIGIVTVYLDLLTVPTISLTVPLCTALVIKKEKSFAEKVVLIFICGASWLFGYAGMWIAKWIICLFAMGPDFFTRYVLSAITERSSDAWGDVTYSRTGMIKARFNDCLSNPVLRVMFIVLITALICCFIMYCLKHKKFHFTPLLPYAILALIPVVWTYVMCNHSWHFFTFRTMAPIIYIIPVALASSIPWFSKEPIPASKE